MLAALVLACADPPDSSCEVSATRISCPHHTDRLPDGVGERDVHWQVPAGPAPTDGWPVVLFFQGSLFPADGIWSATRATPFGGWHQVEVTRSLLDAGYAVLSPETQGNGLTAWNTNLPPWSTAWEGSPDDTLMSELFAATSEGSIGDGALSTDRWYAVGISSGGYMTSRMAVSYPGRFTALTVVAGSYATCAGVVCRVPDELPDDHPPTRFLHGALDPVVPIATMRPYRERLASQGIDTDERVAPFTGHAWSQDAPDDVVDWFDHH